MVTKCQNEIGMKAESLPLPRTVVSCRRDDRELKYSRGRLPVSTSLPIYYPPCLSCLPFVCSPVSTFLPMYYPTYLSGLILCVYLFSRLYLCITDRTFPVYLCLFTCHHVSTYVLLTFPTCLLTCVYLCPCLYLCITQLTYLPPYLCLPVSMCIPMYY